VSAQEIECGSTNLICPEGSSVPTSVTNGYYTLTSDMTMMTIRSSQTTCRQNRTLCVEYPNEVWYFAQETHIGGETTRSREVMCEAGHFCINGKRFEAKPGTFIQDVGSESVASELCEAGFYCEAASVSSRQNSCDDVSTFCEIGSSRPTPVSQGYRTIKHEFYVSQVLCSRGSWCEGGQSYKCISGTYGSEEGLSERTCTAPCPAGFYCPTGSSNPIHCGNHSVYCPFGSVLPIQVSAGYYTTQGTYDGSADGLNSTRSWQLICEPGFYCIDGVKQPCNSGLYVWVVSLCVCVCVCCTYLFTNSNPTGTV